MKFTNYLKEISDVSNFPMISLIMFVSIFALVIAYVFTADKKEMDKKAEIPLH